MDKRKVSAPAVRYTGQRKNLIWIKPSLVAEIEYRDWTHDRKLRHASYKGLRDTTEEMAVCEIE